MEKVSRNMKKTFYTEWAYILGVIILALGTALMVRADFGMSMVVAPAYLLHLKISEYLPFFTFGMAEYCFQFLLVILLSAALGKFRVHYLFSVVTAVFYGLTLDGLSLIAGLIPANDYIVRGILFVSGMLLCALGVALQFQTYLPPEAYELVVKEISERKRLDIGKVKTVYDLSSLALGVILSFCFFGLFHFEGVRLGTLITALCNGTIIGKMSVWLNSRYTFRDGLKFRKYFT